MKTRDQQMNGRSASRRKRIEARAAALWRGQVSRESIAEAVRLADRRRPPRVKGLRLLSVLS